MSGTDPHVSEVLQTAPFRVTGVTLSYSLVYASVDTKLLYLIGGYPYGVAAYISILYKSNPQPVVEGSVRWWLAHPTTGGGDSLYNNL